MTAAPSQDSLPLPPPFRDLRFRTEMTVSCVDCEAIPKHEDAGKISTVDGVRVQTMHNGIRVVAGGYGGEWTEEIIARLRGHHEPQEELVFHHILQRLPAKATMIELGGNWSYYSLWFLDGAADERRAIVVEPDPNNLETGRRNARLNGRTIEFIQASAGMESSPGKSFRTETAGVLELPQVTVAELVEQNGIERLDILHCDAQGAELDVLRSALDLMRAGRIGFVVISTHGHQVCGDPLMHQRCLALVESAGGAIVTEHEVHESFSGDGLIVAAFGEDPAMRAPVKVSLNRYSNSLFRNPLFDLEETVAARRRLEAEVAGLEAEVAGLREEKRLEAEKAELPAAPKPAEPVAEANLAPESPARPVKEAGPLPARAPVEVAPPRQHSFLRRASTKLRAWRRHATAEVDRYLARQRRSIEKRLQRGKGLPAAPATASELTEPAEIILWRLQTVRRHVTAGRANAPPRQ
jgi:FkbM family methyltransferase